MAAKDRVIAAKSLVSFLMGLEGVRVRIELHNDIFAVGVLDQSDSRMNISLRNAQVWRPSRATMSVAGVQECEPIGLFEEFFVQGTKIRCIHIEDKGVNPMKVTEKKVGELLHCRKSDARRITKKRQMKYDEERKMVQSTKLAKEKARQLKAEAGGSSSTDFSSQ